MRNLLVALAACLSAAPADAQNVPGGSVTLSWSTQEIVANSGVPSFASPGMIEPGEGVRFSLQTAFTPEVGTEFDYFGHEAFVAGLGDSFFRFLGSGEALGTFTRFALAPGVEANNLPQTFIGNSIDGLDVFQPAAVGNPGPINPVNPFPDVVTFDWIPSSFTPRSVTFQSQNGITAGAANALVILVMGPNGPYYSAAGATGIHNPIAPIVIVPAPSSLALLAWVAAIRRRR